MVTAEQDKALELVDGRVRALRRELAALGDRYDDAEESELTRAITMNRRDRPLLGLLLAEKVLRRAIFNGSRSTLDDFLFRFGAHVKASVGLQGLSAEDRVTLALAAREVFRTSNRMRKHLIETESILDRLPDASTSDPAWRRQFGITRDEFEVKVALVAGARHTRSAHEPRPPQGPRILRERSYAVHDESSIPDWLTLPTGAPESCLHGSKNWPRLESVDDTLPSFAGPWTSFESGAYRECLDSMWEIFARCGSEWFPTDTQDGARTWNWLRLVWLLGRQAGEGLQNRQRALVSALLAAQRSVPTETDLIDDLITGALADYVAVEPGMRRNWAVHAARIVVVAGGESLNIYDGAQKADLRSAWQEHFGDLVQGMRQTHQMVEALTSEYKFRSQELTQAAVPDDQVQRRIVPAIRRVELFLDSEEREIARSICEASTALTTQLAKEAPLASDLVSLQSTLAEIQEKVSLSESILLQDTLGPSLIAMSNTCSERQDEASSSSRPEIVASLISRRLPLSSKVHAPFSIEIALRNIGNTSAELIEATLESLAVEVTEPLQVIERIPPGAERVVEFTGASLADADIAPLSCELTWRDQLEQIFFETFDLRAEDQRPTAWTQSDVNPFSLQTITDPENLVGRREDLDALRRLVSAGGSVAVTGLKRVGKSSLAKSLLSRMQADGWATDFLPLGQVLTGNPSASEFVTALIETIYDAISLAETDVAIPQPPRSTAESFTRTAGRWVRQVAAIARRNSIRVLVAVDDFDELPSSLYEGPEADALFLFVRSVIDEPWLSLMFIGSEVLPAILGAQAHKLNQVATLVVSNFNSVTATQALLEDRTRTTLEWQSASFNRAHFLCGGNPYYLTLLGQEVWQRMRDLDRTFVAVGDIEEASGRLARSASATHFLHLWSDSLAGLKSQGRRTVIANAVLVAVSRASGPKYANASRHHVIEAAIASVPSATNVEVSTGVSSLLSRGVLIGDEQFLRLSIPLASGWLQLTGASQLDMTLVELREVSENQHPVSNLDLLHLTKNVMFCGEQISETRLSGWLEQFPPTVRYAAFQVARRMLSDGYFSSTRMAQEVLPKLKSNIMSTEAWGLRVADHGGYAKNVYVLQHGLPGSSSPGFVSTLIRLLKVKKSNVVDIEKFQTSTKGVANPSILIIADDLAGTGTQLRRVVDEAVSGLSSPSGPWRENLHVVIAAAISASGPVLTPDDVNAESVTGVNLGNSHRLFDGETSIFDSPGEQKRALDVFEAIGRSLLPNNPRGFGALGLLAATESNCPNNAPPMFWKSGEYAGKPWIPLLERRI